MRIGCDFGQLSADRVAYWLHQNAENLRRSKMHELLMKQAEDEHWHRSVCRRNAMIRLFLARWGAIEALRELRDPPFQTSGRVRIQRKWRDRVIP